MELKIGTFNLNNLFSRFNFDFMAEVEDLKEGSIEIAQVRKILSSDDRLVSYQGRALKRKDPEARKTIARRIEKMDLDILSVQEVEDIDTLRYFVRHELTKPLYPHIVLIEGNDPRLIDLGLLSKYPIGAVTSWQHITHSHTPKERVFSRDLLQVEILDHSRSRTLLTLFSTHLKSHFVPFHQDQEKGKKESNEKRKRQADAASWIIEKEMRPQSKYVVLGDFNDAVDSTYLQPLIKNNNLNLKNGLIGAKETRPSPSSSSPLKTTHWTHRYKPSGKEAQYELFDQIWLSPSLAHVQTAAWIDRREKMGGDGSDHDPAWVVLNI